MPAKSSFTTEVVIAAPPETVWRALTVPAGRRRWLNDAEVRSAWTPGASILIDVVLESHTWHDRGTVLDAEPPRLLRYSLWSSISRRPDTPEHHSIVTFEAAPAPDGRTVLTLRHDGLGAAAAAPHAAFFWPVALHVLRDEIESRLAPARRMPTLPITGPPGADRRG